MRRTLSAFVLFIGVIFLLAGCSGNDDYISYKITVPQSRSASMASETYRQEYLSKDVCVIPTKKQSQKDRFMTAKAAFLIDDTTGTMLYSHNIYKKMYPASITKIVTALVALKYGNLNETVTFSYKASHITEYGAKLCGFQEGDKIKLKKLLYSFLVCSGNDAGIAIAEHIAGSEGAFTNMMNEEMRLLGASGSHFVNSHGLHDDNHYTTPYDLYLVFHELLKNETFLDIINHSQYKAVYKGADGKKKSVVFLSTDKYLLGTASAPEGVTVVGGKTGTTSQAGSNLILYTKDEAGKNYVSLVMKAAYSESLYEQMNHLLKMEHIEV